ncbi:Estradiol 17-beta-dehydrogenase 8 [Eumeta japonica]|uniref:Estradiol 17-beta-dehydrogenase 8 n=1 Tax=Eumeta variegata TaxID=151549 RepID=A0A4C1SUJ6_EUMVA|nr:Estradiol 17-beta-dehydrogenase 8 [Eumeta japonica]
MTYKELDLVLGEVHAACLMGMEQVIAADCNLQAAEATARELGSGHILVTQQFAKAMIEHNIKGGSIVNISSIVAKMNNIGQANYAATKAGIISFTEVAAKEFGKFGIRVNAIMPGYINTPMSEVVPEKIKEQIVVCCPMGRMGEPTEVAEVIAFLASDKSSYVNGAAIEVTGGLK